MDISGTRARGWSSSYTFSQSSNKKMSEKLICGGRYQKRDTSYKVVYQLSSDGTIVKVWDNMSKIAEHFNTYNANVRRSILDQTIINGFLYIKMLEYKTTIDYPILFKYLKYKGKVRTEF